ncbi:CoA ester lyase [Nocardioidaceae bacterium SCSIO 66511]|nr:CoA ester lyase [Nocardioidaceae bacterium SCSIO 66511]
MTPAARELAVTYLYVPADRPERVAKAFTLGADVVIMDLEDAVAPEAKVAARSALPALVSARGEQRVQVRVNAVDTEYAAADLATVAGLDTDIEVRLPKVESPQTIDEVRRLLGGERPIHALVETAIGIEQAFDIARYGPPLASIGLGEADLRSALGVSDDRALEWARGRIVVAAAAAGLPAPAQSPYLNVRDLVGLSESSQTGRSHGFVGRCAIHPAQLAPIRAAYRPVTEEVVRAQATLDRLAHGAVDVLDDGSFIDPAMVGAARRVLDLERLTREPGTRSGSAS